MTSSIFGRKEKLKATRKISNRHPIRLPVSMQYVYYLMWDECHVWRIWDVFEIHLLENSLVFPFPSHEQSSQNVYKICLPFIWFLSSCCCWMLTRTATVCVCGCNKNMGAEPHIIVYGHTINTHTMPIQNNRSRSIIRVSIRKSCWKSKTHVNLQSNNNK